MKLKNLLLLSEEPEVVEEEEQEGMLVEAAGGTWAPGQYTFFGPETRWVPVTGPITEDLAVGICSQIQDLSARDAGLPITLYINTGGGGIIDALSIYDIAMMVPNPIVAVVAGGAMSAGLVILAAAQFRLATPNSQFFYHEPIMTDVGYDSEYSAKAHYNQYAYYKELLAEILRRRARMTKLRWKRLFGGKTQFYFDAVKAMELNFIDDILEHDKKDTWKAKK